MIDTYKENEVWKDYYFHGLSYKVSNYGKVMGIASGRILKQRIDVDGYPIITVGSQAEGRTAIRIHRLVAILFVDNPNGYNEVNHKDFNRTNNYYANLEWTTHEENIQYTLDAGRAYFQNHSLVGELNPNYGNHTLKEKYKVDPELARINNSRPGEQNGRAKEIYLFDGNKKYIKKFDYIGQCAEYLRNNKVTNAAIKSIRTNITQSIKSHRLYLHYYFSFSNIINN